MPRLCLEGLTEALKRLDRNVERGTPIEDAARGAFQAALPTLADEVAVAIANHVEANHRTRVVIDRYGRVAR